MVRPVEHAEDDSSYLHSDANGLEKDELPVKEPVLALRSSRSGNIFVVITETTITVWQTKVRLDASPPFPSPC